MINIDPDDIILFISGHTDDVELACGATLAKCLRLGNPQRIFYLALTSTDDSIILEREATQAMQVLGVLKGNYWFLQHPNTAFPLVRQEILEDIENIRDKINPSIVFCPSFSDMHQDHSTTAWETMRAFKKTVEIILGYDICWNTIVKAFDPHLFVQVSENDLLQKIKAIRCYKSQVHRGYMSERLAVAQAIVTAGKASLIDHYDVVHYAEGFEIYRGVWF